MSKNINVTIRQIRERHHVTTKAGAQEILEVIAELIGLVNRNYREYVVEKGSFVSDMSKVEEIARHWIKNTEGRY